MPRPEEHNALSDRAKATLNILIEYYIKSGQPIASKTLSNTLLALSSATIRNVMSDLENAGLIQAPHTSAGRIPTVKGYRVFVDSLLTLHPPLQSEQIKAELSQLKRQLPDHQSSPQQLIASVSDLLSTASHLAGIVMVPCQPQPILRQIEFLPLESNRLLVILILNQSDVQNRIIHPQHHYSLSELEQAANYLTEQFAGHSLTVIRKKLLIELNDAKECMNQFLKMVLTIAEQAIPQNPPAPDYVLSGQTNLMGINELADIGKLRQLFDIFLQKQVLLHLFDQCLQADGVQILIGEESGFRALDTCSIITAPYKRGEQSLGVLGIIGPTRMDYQRMIPMVEMTAKLFGDILNQSD